MLVPTPRNTLHGCHPAPDGRVEGALRSQPSQKQAYLFSTRLRNTGSQKHYRMMYPESEPDSGGAALSR
jgi:hypothetical protein